LTFSHYRNAIGAIVVYDITKEKSFRNVRNWVQNVREHADPSVEILIVGNKSDLPYRVISRAQGQQLAN
jgi:Ras-related protein Rab-11A